MGDFQVNRVKLQGCKTSYGFKGFLGPGMLKLLLWLDGTLEHDEAAKVC